MSTNDTLLTQATPAMTRKQYWGNISKGSIVIIMWGIAEFTDVTVSAVVAAAVTMMAGASVGYFVRDRVA